MITKENAAQALTFLDSMVANRMTASYSDFKNAESAIKALDQYLKQSSDEIKVLPAPSDDTSS